MKLETESLMSNGSSANEASSDRGVADAGAAPDQPIAHADPDIIPERVEPPRPIAIPADSASDDLATCLREGIYRLVEIPLALVVLLLASPVMLILAVLIRLESPGPALFVHYRTGRSRRVLGRDLDRSVVREPAAGIDPDRYYWVPTRFPFLKFRTMYADAAERYPHYYWWRYDLAPEQIQAMHYKTPDDPRLTRLGKWIREKTLDELPNFWNLLTGDVHLVGPRPEEPAVQALYSEEQMRKFTVKPGLTCLSKIKGRGDLPVGEQIEWDLEYVRRRSLWLDLRIALKTIELVVKQDGAY